MAVLQLDGRDRVRAGMLAALLVLAIGGGLVLGLRVAMPARASTEAVFALLPVAATPEKRIVPRHARSRRPQGAAAPPNLRAKPTEVVAPPIVMPMPSPVIAAPIAGPGAAATSGATDRVGPGTGAGGIGDGTGSGGTGDGDGDGGYETPPRRVKGRIRDSDYPRGAADSGAGGMVSVRYAVETDGRVTGCRVTQSSGNADLDATTCRLITQRFRYRPSLDALGRPVRSIVVVDHDWEMTLEPPEPR